MYSEKNEPAHDIVFDSYMGEQITDCKVIRVWVRWWTTSIVHRRFYDSIINCSKVGPPIRPRMARA
jgi:hypothetical protein